MDSVATFSDFQGVNTTTDPARIRDNEFQYLENVYVENTTSQLKIREGYVNYADPAVYTNTDPFIYCGIYIYTFPTGQTMPFNLGVVKSAFSPNSYVYASFIYGRPPAALIETQSIGAYSTHTHGEQYNNKYYLFGNTGIIEVSITSGIANPLSGLSVVNVAPTIGCSYGTFFKDRLFVVRTGVSGGIVLNTTISYSEIGTPGTVPDINFFRVGLGDGEPIVALQVMSGDRLLIFKENSIWTLYASDNDPATWTLKKTVSEKGTVFKESVKYFDNQVYFVSLDGVYRTDGTNLQLLSSPIEHYFTTRQAEEVEGDNLTPNKMYGCIYNNQYIIMATNTVNSVFLGRFYPRILVYNFEFNIWYFWRFAGNGTEVVAVCPNTLNITDPSYLTPFGTPVQQYFPGLYFYNGSSAVSIPVPFFGVYRNQYDRIELPVNSKFTDGARGGINPSNTGYTYLATIQTKVYDFGSMFTFKRFKQAVLQVRGQGLYTLYADELISDVSIPSSVTVDDDKPTFIKYKLFRFSKQMQFKIVVAPNRDSPSTSFDVPTPVSIYGLSIFYSIKSKIWKRKENG
jgi:hypothetical protein